MKVLDFPPPPPMPDVRRAQIYHPNLQAAVERLRKAWNSTEAEDAIRSIRFYTDAIEKILKPNELR